MNIRKAFQIAAIAIPMLIAPFVGLVGVRTVVSSDEGLYAYCRDGVGISATDFSPTDPPNLDNWYSSRPSDVDWIVNQDQTCREVTRHETILVSLLLGMALVSALQLIVGSRVVGIGLTVLKLGLLVLLLGYASHRGPQFVLWGGGLLLALDGLVLAYAARGLRSRSERTGMDTKTDGDFFP